MEQKRKLLFWTFKLLSILVSCALPIWGICEKFPIWTENHGAGRTIGAGVILIFMVLVIVFRRAVFAFVKDKLKLHHAPPVTIWLIFLIISYIFVFLGDVMKDMTTVFWLGSIGSAIGTVLTFVSEQFKAKETT